MTNINWGEKARLYVAHFTKRNTPLTAIHYFNESIDGPGQLITMVAGAMKKAYEDGLKMGKRTQKKDEEVS